MMSCRVETGAQRCPEEVFVREVPEGQKGACHLVTEFVQIYPKRFFDLQLLFAQKMAELGQQDFQEAVLHSTAFYRILGLDWSLDPRHPVWQEYLQQIQGKPHAVEQTYHFYLQRYKTLPKFTDQPHWGCFAYEYQPATQAIHLHFSNQDLSGYGALSAYQREVRLVELTAMFRHVQQAHPEATSVCGNSWLYHRESYRRLFPAVYVQSAQTMAKPALFGRAIWGQFLRHDWQVNEETASLFLQRVDHLEAVDRYVQCFPYSVLQTTSPISAFYAFYGIF